jgi:hypothetical protein
VVHRIIPVLQHYRVVKENTLMAHLKAEVSLGFGGLQQKNRIDMPGAEVYCIIPWKVCIPKKPNPEGTQYGVFKI